MPVESRQGENSSRNTFLICEKLNGSTATASSADLIRRCSKSQLSPVTVDCRRSPWLAEELIGMERLCGMT